MRRVPQDDRDLRSDILALKCHVAVAVIDKLFVIAVVLFIGVGALVMLRALIIIWCHPAEFSVPHWDSVFPATRRRRLRSAGLRAGIPSPRKTGTKLTIAR